jgi:MFS transporter, ACS family, glucarate transporter
MLRLAACRNKRRRDETVVTSQLRGSRGSIVALLWSFAFLSYLLRVNITVAQQYMAREFAFSDTQIGYIFSAFLIGYSLFQIPGGALGDKWGPRLVLGACGAWWVVTTSLTGLLPGRIWSGTGAILLLLIAIRFLHGVGQAATYPVAMTAVSNWFPARQHAFVNAVIFTGSTVGSAFAPPVVAQIMTAYGWRAAFYLTAALPLILVFFWLQQTRTLATVRPVVPRVKSETWWRVFRTRNLFFLCLSYFCYCYSISIFVYWLFKYLVDVRHLSILNSGWVNSLPWITASVCVPLFGHLSTKYSDKVGLLRGRRTIASGCLLAASALLYVGAQAADIGLAIGAIALSVGLLFSTESSYFSTAIQLAGRDSGAASGIMNLAGNMGGVAATSAVPVLVLHYSWFVALLTGSALAILAALAWFGLKTPQPAAA